MLDLFDAACDLSAAIEALHAATALYTAEPEIREKSGAGG
jgi:hypothetical protein